MPCLTKIQIAMTKKEILDVCTSAEQKQRVEDAIMAAERFGRPNPFANVKSKPAAVIEITKLMERYAARKKAQLRRAQVLREKKENENQVLNAYQNAISTGATKDEVIIAIESIYKAKHNAAIEKKIAELQAKLI